MEMLAERQGGGVALPVQLLIQMRLSKQTEEVLPTATVSGTCHCKLQREAERCERGAGGLDCLCYQRLMVADDLWASVSLK